MKRIFVCLVCFFFSSALMASCPKATATDASDFCASFKVAAQCHCSASGALPTAMCMNVKLLYQRLMATFGSIEKTCKFQRDTTTEDCIDSWHCYLKGGKNAQGKLCNATGRPCP